jgi:serine phosphatase RsbU (regulator of sigma subunit)
MNMTRVNLQNLIGRKKDAALLITNLINAMATNIAIEDAEGRLLVGETIENPTAKFPIQLEGETIGWVCGAAAAESVAELISHLAAKEAEKKTLGNEVLHLYREVNLIYNFSEKLAALLDLTTVAKTSLELASQLIKASGGSVMLLDDATQTLNVIADFGQPLKAAAGIKLGEGIVGGIAASGNAEIINYLPSHSQYVSEYEGIVSLACAPLKVNERVNGVIVLVSAAPVNYTAADLKLLMTLALQTATAIENALLFGKTVQAAKDREQLLSITKELDVASRIQKSMVPRKFPPFPERDEFEILATMTPAKEVGGDFYDFFLIDEEQLGFVIGDVSGKGVPAALYMAVCRTLIKSTALRGLPPQVCLEQINGMLAAEGVSNMFVTVFYGILNTRSGEVAYCNGGHNPPYILRRDGRVEATEMTGGLVLGVFGKATYQAKQITLGAGDGLFLYTDGITEAMDSENNEFTESRLEDCLRRRSSLTLAETISGVVDEVKKFVDGAPQNDDMTILALKYSA